MVAEALLLPLSHINHIHSEYINAYACNNTRGTYVKGKINKVSQQELTKGG